jgi:hypothetical protein
MVSFNVVIHVSVNGPADAISSDRYSESRPVCGPRGVCRREPLTNDPGRRTWCPDCRTVFDDYGTPVNPIPEYTKAH